MIHSISEETFGWLEKELCLNNTRVLGNYSASNINLRSTMMALAAACSKILILLLFIIYVRKKAVIRNRYNQAPHLSQDTTGESNKNRIHVKHHTHDSLEARYMYVVAPFCVKVLYWVFICVVLCAHLSFVIILLTKKVLISFLHCVLSVVCLSVFWFSSLR